jgi:DNA-binding HxlR family transcriptional regulator
MGEALRRLRKLLTRMPQRDLEHLILTILFDWGGGPVLVCELHRKLDDRVTFTRLWCTLKDMQERHLVWRDVQQMEDVRVCLTTSGQYELGRGSR